MRIKNKMTWLCILLLVIIEQAIKIIINNKYLNAHVPVLPPFLYFEPMFNRDYSWVNSMLQLGVGKWLHIALVSIMIIFIYMFYQYLNYRTQGGRFINFIFAFVFAGALCSLIDKVFWNGSLDYILLNGFFTFDLKDVYVNVSVALLVLLMIVKNEAFKQIDDKNFIRDFMRYVLKRQ